MALILSTFLAISVTLISLLRTTKLDLDGFLFGNILSVAPADVQQTFFITLIILVAVKLLYKELLFYTFDPLGAQASGLPVNWIYFGMMSAITLTIVGEHLNESSPPLEIGARSQEERVRRKESEGRRKKSEGRSQNKCFYKYEMLPIVASLQTVGALLVISLLIGPGITAYLLVKELHLMMGLGAMIGITASVTGMYLSYYLNMPSGAAIVLVVFGLFLVALLFSPSQGILTRKRG
ncbi:metal ABC transporter permease [Microcoleus sp. F8-D3]